MSQSLEIRVPFMDFRLVERLARVHPSEKFEGGRSKSIFRKAIADLVPEGIQYRRDKKGFTVPDNRWLRGPLKPFMLEMFGSDTLMGSKLGLVDMETLRALHAHFLAGKGYLSGRSFFRVYALETFLQRFAANIGT
jgi:asparagine synthase (glutamine-hydrolysing)